MVQETIHAKCEVVAPPDPRERELMLRFGLDGNNSINISSRGRRTLPKKCSVMADGDRLQMASLMKGNPILIHILQQSKNAT